MHFRQYVKAVDECIGAALRSISDKPESWMEDHISMTLCGALQDSLRRQTIEGLVGAASVGWDAFKQRGTLEERHGDIAVLVQYVTRDGSEPLCGVGMLEAKRTYFDSGRYDAIKWSQLEEILKTTRYSMLLLYNHREIRGYGDNIAFQQYSADENLIPYSRLTSPACVVQTPTALLVHENDHRLHRHSVPLSHQLCNRYLRFMDLDTAPDTVRGAEGWIKTEGRRAPYLLVASVVQHEKPQPPSLNVNQDVYERIVPGKPRDSGSGGGGGGPGAPSPKPVDEPDRELEPERADAYA